MKFRTINGKFTTNNIGEIINLDKEIIKENCIILKLKNINIYKIEKLSELIPLVYGRYDIDKVKNFPIILIEDTKTDDFVIKDAEELFKFLKLL